jgi:hypothetical protein
MTAMGNGKRKGRNIRANIARVGSREGLFFSEPSRRAIQDQATSIKQQGKKYLLPQETLLLEPLLLAA